MFKCRKSYRVLYLHGFGAYYDTDSEKVRNIKRVFGKVHGENLDYTRGFDYCRDQAVIAILDYKPDILFGSSMGGHLAMCLSVITGVPFMAVNPAVFPKVTLAPRVGTHISQEILDTYPAASTHGSGMIFIETGDTVVDYTQTQRMYNHAYTIVTYPGGEHRFTRSLEAAKLFRTWYRSND
jgi:predicted esterase YcpF (UPF0227 family)